MDQPTCNILLLAVVLFFLVQPTFVADSDEVCPGEECPYVLDVTENEHCLDTQHHNDAACPEGRRVGDLDGGEPRCVLCESKKTFQPSRSLCEKCVLCKKCGPGFIVEAECTLTSDTVCVPAPKSSTLVPVHESTQSSAVTQGTTKQRAEDDSTTRREDDKLPQETLPEKGKNGWNTAVIASLSVVVAFLLAVGSCSIACYVQQLRIWKLKRELLQKSLESPDAQGAQVPTSVPTETTGMLSNNASPSPQADVEEIDEVNGNVTPVAESNTENDETTV